MPNAFLEVSSSSDLKIASGKQSGKTCQTDEVVASTSTKRDNPDMAAGLERARDGHGDGDEDEGAGATSCKPFSNPDITNIESICGHPQPNSPCQITPKTVCNFQLYNCRAVHAR